MKRYDVLDLIGTGGMGTVYRAFDRLTGETVALKRIERVHGEAISSQTDATFLQSLAHEFSVLAGLRHPNIIAVKDYGFSAQFDELQQPHVRPFFTMEWLQHAQTIVEAAETASFERRVSLVVQLLQALAYLHRRGVLHRDLKPANVLVADDIVRVLDFGLASPGSSYGEFAGTIAYMPPEMLRDYQYFPSSDLYAVGVLATEIFTGHLPFGARDIQAILFGTPDLSGLPDERLHPILTRLLHKTPSERFADAHAAQVAIAEIIGLPPEEPLAIRESYLQAAPFIGREAEMNHLQQALQSAHDGAGRALLVMGESGVGKTRLLNEVRIHALTSGFKVYRGQAQPGVSYDLWRDILAHLVIDSETITTQEASILQPLVPDIERMMGQPVVSAVLLEGESEQQRLAYTMINLIQRLNQPVMLVLDDLQWAQDSQTLLEVINRATAQLPLLVVGTYRSDDTPSEPATVPGMTTMPLERFAQGEIARLCRAMIGEKGTEPDLIAWLQRESEGNVFFLIEILRALAERSGQLAQVGEAHLPAGWLPQGIAQIVDRRLAFVPDWARPLLHLAAIAGSPLDLAVLQEASDMRINMIDWLYACMAVIEIRDNQWYFAHDKLRNGIILQIPDQQRQALHGRLARAIEALYADDVTYAERLAIHWADAGEKQRALPYMLKAAAYLKQSGALSRLVELAQRGLMLVDEKSHEYVQLLNYLGHAYALRDFEAAHKALQQAYDLSTQQGWQNEAVSAAQALVYVSIELGQLDQAARLVDQLIKEADKQQNQRHLAIAYKSNSSVLYRQGQIDASTAMLHHYLELAYAVDDPLLLMNALHDMAVFLFQTGRSAEARPYAEETLERAHDMGALGHIAIMLFYLATAAARQQDYETAVAYFDKCIPMLEMLGDHINLIHAYFNRSSTARTNDRMEEAEQWLLKAHTLAGKLNYTFARIYSLIGLTQLQYDIFAYQAARDYCDQSFALAKSANETTPMVMIRTLSARIYLKLGLLAAARDDLSHALQSIAAMQWDEDVDKLVEALFDYLLYNERPLEAAALLGTSHHNTIKSGNYMRWYNGRIEELEAYLDADELNTALESGQKRDIVMVFAQFRAEFETV